MRMVVVLPAAPHPFGNTAARWFYVLIRELLAAGHRVVCFSVCEEPPERLRECDRLLQGGGNGRLDFRVFPMRSASRLPARKLRSLWRPFSETLYADGFREALAAELRRGYDVLHLEQLWTGWAGLGAPRALLNVHHFEVIDCEGRAPASLAERKALWQMRRATSRILRGSRHVRVFTPRLLEKARSMNPGAEYWVVPFALDPALYPMQPAVAEPVVGLTGSMHWLPSRSAAERLLTRIWPLIRQRVPRARLYVAGWNARRYLGGSAAPPEVVIEENLAHPADFFSKAAVMVYAPSRGSGMKIKVLEAMAYGVPVVTTWEGVEGLDYRDGEHCWVAEEDERIADLAARLLEDAARRQALRAAARRLIETSYSPAPVMARLSEIHVRVANQGDIQWQLPY